MNEKQVKKWVAISIILCYVFFIVPLITSMLYVPITLKVYLGFATVSTIILRVMFSVFFLAVLMLLIYSDELLQWLDKTRIGKWILAHLVLVF